MFQVFLLFWVDFTLLKILFKCGMSGKPGLALTSTCKETKVSELQMVCVRTQSDTHNAIPTSGVSWGPEGHFLIDIRHLSRAYLSLGEDHHLKDSICSNALPGHYYL